MTLLDVTLRNTATSLLGSFGKVLTITHVSSAQYNPVTRKTSTAETIETANGFIEDFKDYYVANGLVKRGDKKITFASQDITRPEIGSRVTINDQEWNIVEVKENWSGDLTATYELQVRK